MRSLLFFTVKCDALVSQRIGVTKSIYLNDRLLAGKRRGEKHSHVWYEDLFISKTWRDKLTSSIDFGIFLSSSFKRRGALEKCLSNFFVTLSTYRKGISEKNCGKSLNRVRLLTVIKFSPSSWINNCSSCALNLNKIALSFSMTSESLSSQTNRIYHSIIDAILMRNKIANAFWTKRNWNEARFVWD